eukprot:820486-Rhodomonas_salina.2
MSLGPGLKSRLRVKVGGPCLPSLRVTHGHGLSRAYPCPGRSGPELYQPPRQLLAPRNQIQETTFLVQSALKPRFLVLDIGVCCRCGRDERGDDGSHRITRKCGSGSGTRCEKVVRSLSKA